jgi:hypothetical protein
VVAGANPALLLRSSDGGATWTTGHPFSDGSTTKGIVSTPAGVFVAGSLAGPWGTVRKSTDGGKTWTTVDNYYGSGSGFQGQLQSICADAQGNVYVGGFAFITTGRGKQAVTTYNWLIRKGTNGGTRWQTIASLQIPGYAYGSLNALSFDAFGNIYAAGYLAASQTSPTHWAMLKSANGGATWSLVDDYLYDSGSQITSALAIAPDAVGNVYAAGFAYGTAATVPGQHWIVRKQVGP